MLDLKFFSNFQHCLITNKGDKGFIILDTNRNVFMVV